MPKKTRLVTLTVVTSTNIWKLTRRQRRNLSQSRGNTKVIEAFFKIKWKNRITPNSNTTEKVKKNNAISKKKDHVWNHEKLFRGGAGDWTRDFPHAKRTLYHWVTPPSCMLKVKIKRFENDVYFRARIWYNFSVNFNLREFLDVQNLSSRPASCKFHWNQLQHCHYPAI